MSKDLYYEIDSDRFRKLLLKYTRKAFSMLPELDQPNILDVGCGSGVPTIELAKLSKGNVVGIDLDQFLLDELKKKIEFEGLSNRVRAIKCSMLEINFPDETFDVIWAEASIAVIGVEKGMKEWKRLLKPSGFLVIHAETRKISRQLRKNCFGYRFSGHLLLPEDVHWREYYEPLETRIQKLIIKYQNNPDNLRILNKHQQEINMVKKNPRYFRSAFYIFQKL